MNGINQARPYAFTPCYAADGMAVANGKADSRAELSGKTVRAANAAKPVPRSFAGSCAGRRDSSEAIWRACW
jgi:hypothetical protein